jgi:mxaJ protein
MSSRFLKASLVLLAMAAGGAPAAEHRLRVCADPDNLPYSRRDGSGFENRIAEAVAKELGATLVYTWLPQGRGLVRKTLNADLCDVLVGVPSAYEPARTTAAYYRSSYVFVYRKGEGEPYRDFDDARLKSVRVGVQLVGDDLATTPPGHALAARGIIDNVTGFALYGERPQGERMMRALAKRDIDVALVWGPQAAYYAARQGVALELSPAHAPPELAGVPFEFSIAMGVRKRDAGLQQALDRAIARRRGEIDAILAEFRVPRAEAAVTTPAQVVGRAVTAP